jgi:hypothetical protein
VRRSKTQFVGLQFVLAGAVVVGASACSSSIHSGAPSSTVTSLTSVPSLPNTAGNAQAPPTAASAAISQMQKQMEVGLGGGTNDGCFGLSQNWSPGKPPTFSVNSPFAGQPAKVALGTRLQLCAAGFEVGIPIAVTIDGPSGYTSKFNALLLAKGSPKSIGGPRTDGYVFGTVNNGQVELHQEDTVYASTFAAAGPAVSAQATFGQYSIVAVQGTRTSRTSVVLGAVPASTGSSSDEAAVATGEDGTAKLVVRGQPNGFVDLGLYEASQGSGQRSTMTLAKALPRVALNARGVGEIEVTKSTAPSGTYCALTATSNWCVDNGVKI